MEHWDWQLTAALLFVLGAVWMLVRRAVRLLKAGEGCGSGCGTCPSKSEPGGSQGARQLPLVSLDETKR